MKCEFEKKVFVVVLLLQFFFISLLMHNYLLIIVRIETLIVLDYLFVVLFVLFVQLTVYSKWRITQCCEEDTISFSFINCKNALILFLYSYWKPGLYVCLGTFTCGILYPIFCVIMIIR